MTWCFQPDCSLHNNYFQMSDEDIQELYTKDQPWRSELKVGDMVDVNIYENEKRKYQAWRQAEITAADDDNLQLAIVKANTAYDTHVSRWSTDLAQFESHTKEDYEWRSTVEGTANFYVDVHDNYNWEQATITQTVLEERFGRPFWKAFVIFRIYKDKQTDMKSKKDEHGWYDGWSDKFDEWIPLYSPRVQMHQTRSGGRAKNLKQQADMDDDIDDKIKPGKGHDRVYMVPRPAFSLSVKFLEMMNMFGSMGGFKIILDILENEPAGDNIDINSLCYMSTMISMGINLWHKDWIKEFGERYAEATQKQLLDANDQVHRSLDKGAYGQACNSISYFNNKTKTREEAEKSQEILQLFMCRKGLKSQLLDRRIAGMKELSNLVKKVSPIGLNSSDEKFNFLVNWMTENEVFDIIWNPRNTHLQLVQRSDAIFTQLLKQKMLS